MSIRKEIFFLCIALFLSNCQGFIEQREAEDNKETFERNLADSEPIEVRDICELMKNHDIYHEKLVSVRSTVHAVLPYHSFIDSDCLTRHPVVDAEAGEAFCDFACSSDRSRDQESLCDLANLLKNNPSSRDRMNLIVEGTFVGRFEAIATNTEYTLNGFRFRIIISRVENVTNVSQFTINEPPEG